MTFRAWSPTARCDKIAHMQQQDLAARIVEARAARGWNQSQLAQALGIDRTTMVKIEQGMRRVTALELVDLSRELQRRIDWFLTPQPEAIVQHRGAATDTGPVTDMDVQLESLADDVGFLTALGRLVVPNRPQVLPRPASVEDAEALGATTRRLAGAPEGPVADLVGLALQLGLLSFSLELQEQDADAAMVVTGETGVALVNASRGVGRRRLALAHELVHFMVDDRYRNDFRVDVHDLDDAHENRVDRAARAILLPPESLRATWAELAGEDTLSGAIRTASAFRVDMSTLARRLHELGLATSAELKIVRGARTTKADILEWNLQVPHDLEGPFIHPDFARAVVRAHAAEDITVERAVALMRGTFSADDFSPRPWLTSETLWGALA